MRHAQTIFVAQAMVELTPEELDIMVVCAESHYDATCRKQAESGGIIYGFVQARLLQARPDSTIMVRCTTSDLDLLCKVLENFSASQFAAYLHDELARILHFLNQCYATTPAYS